MIPRSLASLTCEDARAADRLDSTGSEARDPVSPPASLCLRPLPCGLPVLVQGRAFESRGRDFRLDRNHRRGAAGPHGKQEGSLPGGGRRQRRRAMDNGFQVVGTRCRAAITTGAATMKRNAAFNALEAPGPRGPDQEKSPFLPNVGEARGQEARLLSACLSTTAGLDHSGRPWRACTRCQWLSSVRMEGAVSRFRLAFVDGGQFWPPLRHGDGLDSAGRCRVLIFVGRSQARPGRSPGASGGFDREPERLRADGRRSAAVGDNDRRGPDQGCAVPSGGATSHLIDRLPVLNRSPGIPVSGQSGKSEPLHGGAPRETTPVHEAGFHPPGGKVI